MLRLAMSDNEPGFLLQLFYDSFDQDEGRSSQEKVQSDWVNYITAHRVMTHDAF